MHVTLSGPFSAWFSDWSFLALWLGYSNKYLLLYTEQKTTTVNSFRAHEVCTLKPRVLNGRTIYHPQGLIRILTIVQATNPTKHLRNKTKFQAKSLEVLLRNNCNKFIIRIPHFKLIKNIHFLTNPIHYLICKTRILFSKCLFPLISSSLILFLSTKVTKTMVLLSRELDISLI